MNDLIGLEYGWGHRPSDGSGKTDCFQLSCEVRQRLGFFNYGPLHEWVYEQYTEASFTNWQLARLLLQNGQRSCYLTAGAIVLFSAINTALGTVTDSGIVYISPGGRVVHSPLPPSTFYCIKPSQ